ncbi:GTP-binding protein REM 2 isoform 6-T7 [Dama dama]
MTSGNRGMQGGGCGTTAFRRGMPFSSSSQSPTDEASPKFQRPYFGSGLEGPTTICLSSLLETRVTWPAPGRSHWRALLPFQVHKTAIGPRLRADFQCPHLGLETLSSLPLTSSEGPFLPPFPHHQRPPTDPCLFPLCKRLTCPNPFSLHALEPPGPASPHPWPSAAQWEGGRLKRSLPAEGRHLAGTLSCKHIETSAALHHNTRELFEGAVRQIRLRRGRDGAGGPRPEWGSPEGPAPPARRESLTKKAKRFLANLVPRNAKFFKQRSRSCHDLSVL